jgi:hypothetical protein
MRLRLLHGGVHRRWLRGTDQHLPQARLTGGLSNAGMGRDGLEGTDIDRGGQGAQVR